MYRSITECTTSSYKPKWTALKLKEKAEKDRKLLMVEVEQRLRTSIEETKKIELANAKIQINKVRTECKKEY